MELAKGLRDSGYQVVYLNASGINEIREGVFYTSVTNIKWTYLSYGTRSIKQSLGFARGINSWLRQNEFDGLYVAQTPIFAIFPAHFWGRVRKKKVFIEWLEIWGFGYWTKYMGPLSGTVGWLIQFFAIQLGDRLLVHTKRAYSQLQNRIKKRGLAVTLLPGLCSNKILELDNTFGHSYSKREDIVFLARFVSEKQPMLALAAVEKYIQEGWTGHFWIIGTGPMADLIAHEIQLISLSNRITLLANIADNQISDVFKKSFILLHPSKREGYGLNVVEAAQYGVPTLLINYKDNAAIDLNVSPRLVANSDKIEEIVKLLRVAFLEQEHFFKETKSWVEVSLNDHSMKSSIYKIGDIFQELL